MQPKLRIAFHFTLFAILALSRPDVLLAQDTSLVDQLVEQTGVSVTQAQGGAGAIFSLAKDRLNAKQFSQVAKAVPDMDTLLQAAPKKSRGLSGMLGGASSLFGGTSGNTVTGLAGLAGAFSQLGLTPDKISQFVPIVTGFIRNNGGTATGSLLTSVLQ